MTRWALANFVRAPLAAAPRHTSVTMSAAHS